jgi:ATP-dependent DNA helicase RecQ
MTSPVPPRSIDDLKKVIARYWGYHRLRPLQEQAMRAVLDGRDSLVVLPTGGGKSLCYQAPALLSGDTTVVISPLIALMKDQVDGLRARGIPAVQIDSSLTAPDRARAEAQLARGEVCLLFVSPERLAISSFQQLLRRINVRAFAIDEAHCISHWGHDFRPDYRQLNCLKRLFPDASVHAFTATATEAVRQDISRQLGLVNPVVLVGNFDRPNLTYRVLPRRDLNGQVVEVLNRHKGEAGIIYCIRRRDVDELTATLQQAGYNARPYHAGLPPEQRLDSQNAFTKEQCDFVVATIAFGMGIDRSNIRLVLHTGMPKSLEHYQQEIGRAGRDGLEAECVLLHDEEDFRTWEYIVTKSAAENETEATFLQVALRHLEEMDRYCQNPVCRHRALVEYFGQTYTGKSCNACDLCLRDAEPVPQALIVAQKVLSCVARVKEAFDIHHVVAVLRGSITQAIRRHGHDQLSTYGLLREHDRLLIVDWIYQLGEQGVLVLAGDEHPVLGLNAASWEVMRGERTVRLTRPAARKEVRKSKAEAASWEGVNRELFEVLRGVRQRLAEQEKVPPHVLFDDTTLRELAAVRPRTIKRLQQISGMGDAKVHNFGLALLQTIREYCRKHRLAMDQALPRGKPQRKGRSS